MKRGGVVGLVLAAGASTRMGPSLNKLTAIVGGKPLVAGPVDAMIEAGLDRVFVVTGYQASQIESALADRNCAFVEHPDWAAGMGASLAAGLRGILESVDPAGLMISVGDLAGLRPEWLRALLASFVSAGTPETICVATCGGRWGHPVLFGPAHFGALQSLTGDAGGRSILESQIASVVEVEIDDEAILRDVDTPADLSEWVS